jgi:hypothetical protein
MLARNRLTGGVRTCAIAAGVVVITFAGAAATPSRAKDKPDSPDPVHYDTSLPLRDIAPAAAPDANEKKEHKQHKYPVSAPGSAADPVVQSAIGATAAPSLASNFEGVGAGFSGPQGSFTVTGAPPDTNAAVGPNHIVEVVNTSLAVFGKTGNVIYGPVPTNTLWSGFGGGCQSNNDGDGTATYDRLANRWIISQFSVSTTPYLSASPSRRARTRPGRTTAMPTSTRTSPTTRSSASGLTRTTRRSTCSGTA